jgi:hypothetical protein
MTRFLMKSTLDVMGPCWKIWLHQISPKISLMRKPKYKTTKVLREAIRIEQLPPMVPRPLAADFALLSVRTLIRAEKEGLLHPKKRNRQSVSYDKDELLAFLGIA